MLFHGILLGISLSFLVGPLLFAIIDAGIGQGFRAGVSLAAGIWASDLLYVATVMYGIGAMEALVALPGFRVWAGLAGGLMLLAFGLSIVWKSKRADPARFGRQPSPPQRKPYLKWWLRGFMLNTINPGTVFFWLGIASGVVVPNGWGKREMLVFFGGMLTTLVVADTLKAWAAKGLRRFLTPEHTRRVQFGIGLLLSIFGVALVVQSFFF